MEKHAETKLVNINELQNWSRNPREQLDFERLKEILDKRGQIMPLILDGRDGKTILGGNMRLKAMKALNWKEAMVAVVHPKDEKEAVEIALEDNDNFGKYVQTQLIELVREFNIDTRINIDLRPTSIAEIMPEELEVGNIPDDEVPEVKTPISQTGDLYELDGHRVFCGDSTIMEDVKTLMGEVHADMFLTDPPYNVAYRGKTKDALEIENDEMGSDSFEQFLSDAFINANLFMKPGAVFYIWHADSEGLNFRKACSNAGWKIRQCLVWVKNAMVMGRQDYQWKHEPCLYGWKEGTHLWASDRKQTTILNFDRPQRNGEHPTMKPVDLFAYQIQNNTRGEDVVLDLFSGSGSGLIACQKTGRISYSMELDPKYTDVIVNRWCEFTGKYDIVRNGQKVDWKNLQGKI